MKALIAGLVVILAALLAAAAIALPQYVETRLRAASGAELTVESVGWRKSTITDVRMGDGLTIATITARYEPSELVDGFVRELAIDGLVLRGALSRNGPTFAALDSLLAGAGDEDGGSDESWAIPLDKIELRNSRVELAAPMGEITISTEGLIEVVEQRGLTGLLDMTILAAPAALIGRLTFTASQAAGYDAQLEITETFLGAAPPLAGEIAALFKDDRLSIDGALYTPDGALALTAGITVEPGAQFDLDGELWVTDLTIPDQLSMSQGRLALQMSGPIPASTDPAGLALSGRLEMDLDEVNLPGMGEGLFLTGAMAIATDGGVVTLAAEQIGLDARHLDLPAPADRLALDLETLQAELRPGPDGLAIDGAAMGKLELSDKSVITADFAGRIDLDPLGFPQRFDLRRLTASASQFNLDGNIIEVDDLRLSLAGSPDAFTGNGRATLSTQSIASLTQPLLSLETALAYDSDGLTLNLAKGTSLDAASLNIEGLAPLALHVETVGESIITMARDGRIHHDLRLALPPMTIETPTLAATVTLPALRLVGELGEGIAEITGGALDLPGHDLALDGIDATLQREGETLRGEFNARRLRHPAVTPLAVSGSFDLAADVIGFSGRLSDSGGVLAVDINGRHSLASGRGDASIGVARLTLDPAGPRPGDLAPGLDGLASGVAGTVAATGKLGWGDDSLTSQAILLVENLSLEVGDLRLEQVNSVITFDSLWPPSTAPGQLLAIGLIDAGLSLTDGIIDFQLRPDGKLFVENAVWRWAGGRLKTQDFLFDPDAAQHGFTLDVDNLDLAEIVAFSDLDNLSATGRLSGQVPVTVSADGLVISAGRLETTQDGGLLRYAPEGAPAALRQGGEGATLALTLLENFRYESLRIDIDRNAGGDAEIAVHLRGANADVYDGYPIEFNLNISGPIDQMLRRGLEGYRVPDAVAERLQGFGGQ